MNSRSMANRRLDQGDGPIGGTERTFAPSDRVEVLRADNAKELLSEFRFKEPCRASRRALVGERRHERERLFLALRRLHVIQNYGNKMQLPAEDGAILVFGEA